MNQTAQTVAISYPIHVKNEIDVARNPTLYSPGGASGDIACVSLPWFCVQTVPNEEARCFNEISRHFKAHYPRVVTRQKRYGRVELVVRPLFPSYLFASFDPSHDAWGRILRIPGVRRLLGADSGSPRHIRAGEVDRLMALGRAGDGVIDQEAEPFAAIAPGSTVRVVEGPFADWTGVCQWSAAERVGVLMTLFAAPRVVALNRDVVRVA